MNKVINTCTLVVQNMQKVMYIEWPAIPNLLEPI